MPPDVRFEVELVGRLPPDVRFEAHYGLKSDIDPSPKSAIKSGHRTAYSTRTPRPERLPWDRANGRVADASGRRELRGLVSMCAPVFQMGILLLK